MAGHVFISHGSENSDEANALCAFIEARGVKCWIAPRDVRPGIDYSEELQGAIENCAAFVVLVTDMANKSPYVRAETEMAFSCHKPIFPVRQADIKPAAGLALFLKIRHWTDAFGKHRDAAMDRLALELQTVVGIAPSAPVPVPAPPPIAAAPPPLAAAPAQERPAAAGSRAGRRLTGGQAVLLALLAVVLVGGAIFLATRPGQKPDQNVVAEQPVSPRVGDNPAANTTRMAPVQTFDPVVPNGEIDEQAMRNALNEARNLLEQGRDPIGEALSVPSQ
ncbi:MAG TPA: toll/interleukin-1 receptor domain-containing protein [Allosphingosinicella sp.]|nr:toll/interleukin-1 receptor domain-containing protein [Allosphingosinicella sp.]